MRPSSSRSVRKGYVRQLGRIKDALMTTEEYLQTAETLKPTELIYGVLRVADSPLAPHQAAVLDLSLSLVSHVRERRLGEIWISPFDVILDATRHLVVQPDLFFRSEERRVGKEGRARGGRDR